MKATARSTERKFEDLTVIRSEAGPIPGLFSWRVIRMDVKPFVEKFIQQTQNDGFSFHDAERMAREVAEAALGSSAGSSSASQTEDSLREIHSALRTLAEEVSAIKASLFAPPARRGAKSQEGKPHA
jgi:hypothetical protein